jgi:serine/threonine-protein kinase HipA
MPNIPDREILSAYRSIRQAPNNGFAGHAVLEQINVLIQQRCALTIRRLTHPAEDTDMGQD